VLESPDLTTQTSKERTTLMRKEARWGWLVIALALVWLSIIPGRVASN